MMRAVLLLCAGLAVAGTGLERQVRGLGGLVKAGDWKEAAVLARQVEAGIAEKAPLDVYDVQVLAEPAAGLGIYRPLAGGVVRGDELYLYAAVRNHGLRASAAGYELDLVSDLVVLDAEGNELARDTAFGESRFSARTPHRDTFVNIALRVTGLPAGSYRMRLIVHDRVGGKTGQGEVKLRIP